MNGEEIFKVLMCLIGEVEPVGATHIDTKRLENLKIACEVARKLISEIDDIYIYNHKLPQYSIKESVKYADFFLSKTLCIPRTEEC